jgi:cytochrome c-type biogenesis protein CcsB
MKHILALISSTRTMIILLLIFAVSIAVATFVENDFGTDAARAVVYQATWFEVLLLLGMVNIIAVIFKHRMYQRAKLTLFVFHLAFVIIILGAGITRYFGREGTMSIREGQVSRVWYSTETHLGIMLEQGDHRKFNAWPVLFSGIIRNHFRKNISFNGHQLKIKVLRFLPHAVQSLQYSDNGNPYLQLVTTSGQGREEYLLTPGQNLKTSLFDFQFTVSWDSAITEGLVRVFDREGILHFIAPFPVERITMGNNTTEILEGFTVHEFFPGMLHNFNGIPMVVKQYMASARISAQPDDNPESQNLSALEIGVTCDGTEEVLTIWGMKDQPGKMVSTKINGLDIGLNYGSVMKELPFALRLNDFIIERYPGSESPSWFESNVQLIDASAGIDREERIYMNHILKHRGYRFYQSSYDMDERGTVLSLNRDGLGTTISYLGYLFMGLGMLLSLVNRKSRFSLLSRMSSSLPKKSLMIAFLIFSITLLKAQTNVDSLPEIPLEIANDFGQILVQDNGGRIEPVSTLSSEILRKIARKENYKGQTSDQVLLGMMVYPGQWQLEPMIRVGHEGIQQELGIESKYASFVDFFRSDSYSGYSLRPLVEEAYRKKPAYRNKFDNEIIRVDERLNIAYLVYTGALFRFFPAPHDASNTWHSPVSAPQAFSGEDSVFTAHILTYFSEEARKAVVTGDWEMNREMLKAIKTFQNTYGEDVIPAKSRTHAEILYNKLDLFKRITRVYLLVGLILLLIQFVNIFVPKFSVKYYVIPAVVAIALAFVAHTLNLALRWYVSGHAPWSNGYEALTFIAWAGILAGLIFSGKSSITVSSSAILASLILQTAHLSWMDPQITNLVPVLKSYWLVIHVAVITASYSFLGLGALVALINLVIMFFENQRNRSGLEDHINKLTYITEMTLIAGLYLLSIGTFLGGVWANESWGRYWAWDPKETWALVTVIVYAVIIHLRLVPGMKGRLLFNILALGGFASVLMTYFGVNYYLSGLHSYAKGDPVPVPPVVYYSVTVFVILSLLAGINQLRLSKLKIP